MWESRSRRRVRNAQIWGNTRVITVEVGGIMRKRQLDG